MELNRMNRWFYLSFDEKGERPAVEVGIYEPLVAELSQLFERRCDHAQMQDDFGFNRNRTDLMKGFGFGHALNFAGIHNGYVIERIEFSRDETIEALSASLALLISLLSVAPILKGLTFVTDPSRQQLMHVQAMVKPGSQMPVSGMQIGGSVSPVVTEKVRAIVGEHELVPLECIERAMFLTSNALVRFPIPEETDGPRRYGSYEAYLKKDGSFWFNGKGGSGVFTDVIGPHNLLEQHKFACSNMDSCNSQLAALAGLAAFHDLLDQPP